MCVRLIQQWWLATDSEAFPGRPQVKQRNLPDEDLPENVVEIFTDGLRVDLVEYPDGDRTSQLAIMCLSHEQEMNKFSPTSLNDKVTLVMRLYSGRCARNWTDVQKHLQEILGDAKRTTVSRHARAYAG